MLTSDTSNNKTTTNCGLLFEAIGGESSMEDIYFGQFKKLYAKNGAVYIRIFLGGYGVDFPVANNDNKYNLYVFEKSKDVYEDPKGMTSAVVYQTSDGWGSQRQKESLIMKTLRAGSGRLSLNEGKPTT